LEIGFVFTNFNNSIYTKRAVESIQQCGSVGAPIIVVDNGSSEQDVNDLKDIELAFPDVTVIYNKENVGYFRGLNIGIEYARNTHKNMELLIVGNNDLIFSTDFYSSIMSNKDKFDKYPVVSPNIKTVDGIYQNPHVISGISKFREIIYDLYHLSYFLARSIKLISNITHKFTDRKDETQHEVAQEIHQGYGACYILGPVFFKHFELLWAPTFLMYEEYFLSKQLEEKGFKFYYEPSIKIQHYCHATTSNLPGRKKWEFSRDAHREYRKHLKIW